MEQTGGHYEIYCFEELVGHSNFTLHPAVRDSGHPFVKDSLLDVEDAVLREV